MSKTTSNDLRKTYSGIFGNQVNLKNRNRQSVMTMPPVKQVKPPTEKQVEVRKQFLLAVAYAKLVMQDPSLLAAYAARARKGMGPYRLAVTDYLNPPFVTKIDASHYHGNAGETIRVTAGDNFTLASVEVKIVAADGSTIEEGVCTFSLPSGNYAYVTTVGAPATAGVTINATALDLPGHTAELSITL